MVAPGGLIPKECVVCGGKFTAKRDRARFCSPRCQMRSSRATKRGEELPPMRREGSPLVVLPKAKPSEGESEGGMVGVTVAALEAGDRLNTPMGQATLLIARILDSGIQDTGSSIAALIRQYDASLTKALDGSSVVETPLERMKRQRQLKAG